MDSLQIPDSALPGPSRQHGSSRPVSVSVHPTQVSPSQHTSSRKRASHNVATSSPPEEQPTYRDVYSHPAALQYAASHPRRTIPKFGPYLLLQTLGEGEFGKVKLGLHTNWGEEVAVKLIKKQNMEVALRASKVEREIEVLKRLKHPNIVRLYDVIETDKYIGIILDYASGGELFDHILAHRYLKEKDACKLFAQLVSGVGYIHAKKIIHRDLKLENLLLDRNRNVIITDFGFANDFQHHSDDLMQTSCGSPCYAAPELVISEGAYVGSAVDIWSCGVILYAMLAGYLPFDDDPANPDGDNINLLYKYIVNTPLSFPEYVSSEARELLSLMLQPDPGHRASLQSIMAHRWLVPYRHLFEKSVEELEDAAMEQHRQKRLAYQRQMRHHTEADNKISRSQSARNDVFPHASAAAASASRSRSQRDPPHASQNSHPEYLYETSVDQSMYASPPQAQSSSRRGVASAIVLPSASHAPLEDDPFAPTPVREVAPAPLSASAIDRSIMNGNGHSPMDSSQLAASSGQEDVLSSTAANGTTSPEGGSRKKKGGMRHTIQVEYGEPEGQEQAPGTSRSPPRIQPVSIAVREKPMEPRNSPTTHRAPSVEQERTPRRPSISSARGPSSAVPMSSVSPPKMQPPTVTIDAGSPPATPNYNAEKASYLQAGSGSTGSGSGSSSRGRHRKGLSIDKMGFGKIFGSGSEQNHATNGMGSRQVSESSTGGPPSSIQSKTSSASRRPSTLQVPPSTMSHTDTTHTSFMSSTATEAAASGKKSRRNTLTVMVEPFSRSIKQRTKGRNVTETPVKESGKENISEKFAAPSSSQLSTPVGKVETESPAFEKVPRNESVGLGMPASSSKARRVMQWFRSRSKGPGTDESETTNGIEPPSRGQTPALDVYRVNASTASVNTTTPRLDALRTVPSHPQRSASAATDLSYSTPSFAERMKRQIAPPKGVLRVHHGAVDQTTITTGSPPEVMKHVKTVLEEMGMEVQIESDYKYRCVRPKRGRNIVGLGLRDGVGSTGGLAAFKIVGSAASNGIDKRGLPQPSSSGGMLKGLLTRRQSSQVSAYGDIPESVPSPQSPLEPVYGDSSEDQGDEVRFYVELTRLDRLNDTFSLDIRRLKGNLRSYKFLYDTVRVRINLQR
ncbi:hypothetical protein EW146_g4379 [Bondarzewia mesenterica]|uniref:Non-specific serine/threonine protein kinase n=1 Tax=Bondarzewia mesenterica TaxID=1095465 RepID=A0A4S4M0I8_9AGAM|nr:hypothetical protein EW146_g4379 [Bondarzewia mesenterica]